MRLFLLDYPEHHVVHHGHVGNQEAQGEQAGERWLKVILDVDGARNRRSHELDSGIRVACRVLEYLIGQQVVQVGIPAA